MFAANRNAASMYRAIGAETAVSNADAHGLVSMLYEGVLASLARAMGATGEQRRGERAQALNRALRLIEEGLRVGLDFKAPGSIAENLAVVYDHCTLKITQAMLDPSTDLMPVVRMLGGLKDAWAQIPPAVRSNPRAHLVY
ncbi:MAG TPA: flagellar export chaperone FliS [Burkholderiaceae bacterium]|nr:flagellar export chaperone FliS [Burkholderiaceae bacterium]